MGVLTLGASAHAGSLTITPTFDSSITSDPNAAAIEGAINAAISNVTSSITSSQNLSVSILFQEQSTGLGNSNTAVTEVTYGQFYNALSTIATANPGNTNLQTALASLPNQTNNPVNGSQYVQVTTAEARNLGFNASPSGYDGTISLNTSITTPGSPDSSLQYDLQAVATHEIDEVLGIGGDGSTIGENLFGNNAVGDLDLYRYSAPGTYSYSTTQTTSPYSYFSIDGGNTVLSYFNQTTGADYGDWLSNPIPSGFNPQVQDAYATPGASPTLGTSEITAFEAIGYDPTQQGTPTPEPGSLTLMAIGMGGMALYLRRRKTAKAA